MQPDNISPAPATAPSNGLSNENKQALSMTVLSETTNIMNPIEYKQLDIIAADFLKSEAISKKFQNVQQVKMALIIGREMGMSFGESMHDLYYVNGQVNVYGKGTPAALRRHGWTIKYKDETNEQVTGVVTNIKTGEVIEDTYTFAEAEQSGFVTGNNGIKAGWLPGANRRRKLRYGVLSLIISTYLPEVIGSAAGIGEYSEDYLDSSEQHRTRHKATDEQKDQIKDDAKSMAAKLRADAAQEAEVSDERY